MLKMSRILITLYVLATSGALILVKLGSKTGAVVHFVDNRLQFNINWYTITGIALYGSSFLLYMYLISKFELGYIIPLTTAFVYLLIFIASYFIFKESFTFTKIVGIAFIVLGLGLLNLKR